MKKEVKTNAMRILDRNKLKYTEHMYECDGFTDGITISDRLGQPYEKVFKTLVTVSKSKKYYVFVVPVAEELDLKKAAAAVGEKSVEMIYVKDITSITGYVRGGCSPIGMKKQFDTVIDITAKEQKTIIFSGGRLGTQIEMNPVELAELINAEFADIKH